MLKVLRSGLSAFSVALATLWLALWIRGSRFSDSVYVDVGRYQINVQQHQGYPQLFLGYNEERERLFRVKSWVGLTGASGSYPVNSFYGFSYDRFSDNPIFPTVRIAAPHWFLVLCFGGCAFLLKNPPRPRWTLLEILLTVTVSALLLGAILSVNQYKP